MITDKCENSILIKKEILEGAFVKLINLLFNTEFIKTSNNIENDKNYKKLDKKREIIMSELSDLSEAYLKKQINLHNYNIKRGECNDKLFFINNEIQKIKEVYKENNVYYLIQEDLIKLGKNNIKDFDAIFFKKFIKYVIIGGRIGSEKKGNLLRFVYNKDKINNGKDISKEEIVDKNIDSGKNNLETIFTYNYAVRFYCYFKDPNTGKRKRKDFTNIKVKFEYEKDCC